MKLQRLDDWQVRLEALCADRINMPFQWGQVDCCMWAADVVQSLTGFDLAHDVRGKYSSAKEAAQLLAKFGGVIGLANSRLGASSSVKMASIGDIVLLNNHGRQLLAVCMGEQTIAPTYHGLGHEPITSAICAWKV